MPDKGAHQEPPRAAVQRIESRPGDLELPSFRQIEAIGQLPPEVRERLGLALPSDRRELDSGPSGPGKSER